MIKEIRIPIIRKAHEVKIPISYFPTFDKAEARIYLETLTYVSKPLSWLVCAPTLRMSLSTKEDHTEIYEYCRPKSTEWLTLGYWGSKPLNEITSTKLRDLCYSITTFWFHWRNEIETNSIATPKNIHEVILCTHKSDPLIQTYSTLRWIGNKMLSEWKDITLLQMYTH